MPGRAPSGWRALSFLNRTRRDSGSAMVTICTAIHGRSNAMAGRSSLSCLSDTVKVARTTAPGSWRQYRRERKRPILAAPHTPDPTRWQDTGLYAAWLGHSTVLIKVDGF